jgi:hypothetical protein
MPCLPGIFGAKLILVSQVRRAARNSVAQNRNSNCPAERGPFPPVSAAAFKLFFMILVIFFSALSSSGTLLVLHGATVVVYRTVEGLSLYRIQRQPLRPHDLGV